MIIRRIALTIVLAGVFASAIFVGAVHTQQQGQQQQGQQQQGQQQQEQQQQGQRGRRTGAPSNPPAGGLLSTLGGIDACKTDGVLESHCEATIALARIFGRLGQARTLGAIPSCERELVERIEEMNWRVNTAIEAHKASDDLLDPGKQYGDNRKISNAEKSRLMTKNDYYINRITRTLRSFLERQNPSRAEYGGLIYHRELVRDAEELLWINFELTKWGVDAAFLTAPRGFAVYQFVFNCVRIYDDRLMTARARAVRFAAESQSFFSSEAARVTPVIRGGREAFRRWWVEKRLLLGSDKPPGFGGGFPLKIFLGTQHGFQRPFLSSRAETAALRCAEGEVRNYYGTLKRADEGPDEIKLFEVATEVFTTVAGVSTPGIDHDCAAEINSWDRAPINNLLTNSLRRLWPQGVNSPDEARTVLENIKDGINGHITNIIRLKRREDCERGRDANGVVLDPAAMATCLREFPQIRPLVGLAVERAQEILEFELMAGMALTVIKSMSPDLDFEELRRHRDEFRSRP